MDWLYGSLGGWLVIGAFVLVFFSSKKLALLGSWICVAMGLSWFPSLMNLQVFGDLFPFVDLGGVEEFLNIYTVISILALFLTVSFIKEFLLPKEHGNLAWWLSFFVTFIFTGWIIYSHEPLYTGIVSIVGGAEWIMILIFDIVLFAVPIYLIVHWVMQNPVTKESIVEGVKSVAKKCVKFGEDGSTCMEYGE